MRRYIWLAAALCVGLCECMVESGEPVGIYSEPLVSGVVEHQVGGSWSGVGLPTDDELPARLLVRTFRQPDAGCDNTIVTLGYGMTASSAPIDAGSPMVRMGIESCYDGAEGLQAEGHFPEVGIGGERLRPVSARADLGTHESTIVFSGDVTFAEHNGTNPIARVSVDARRLSLYPSVQLATTDGSRVPIRGAKMQAGTLELSAYAAASLPSASPANQVIIIIDEGGRALAISDGTDWHRIAFAE